MNIIEKLNWRYATKRMTGAKVPQEKVDNIIEAIRLSASAYGLQPYKVIVIENEELRKKLQPAAYNQPQIVESSHLLVFAPYSNINKQHIEDFINLNIEVRNAPAESLSGFKAMLEGSLLGNSEETNYNWAARQAYIALGTGLVAAANEQVDATPMEGFNPAQFDEILGLKEQGLRSVALLALGYRDEANDYLAKAKKVRKHTNNLVINHK
jgi:nitroreductase